MFDAERPGPEPESWSTSTAPVPTLDRSWKPCSEVVSGATISKACLCCQVHGSVMRSLSGSEAEDGEEDDRMPMSAHLLIVAAVVIFAGYFVFGVTGFGASPITIPVLVQLLPLTLVLPLAAVLDLAAALALSAHTRRHAATRELLALVPFTLIGLALGVTLLVRLPRRVTLLALGVFVCAYALYVIARRGGARTLSRVWAVPAGIVGGVAGALFGMGGPPYVMY